MPQPLILQAALAGPRLIGRAPLAFLAWVLLRLVEQYITLVILLGARLAGAMLNVGAVWSVLASLPFEAILVCALLRAQFSPQARSFAYLRVGGVELRMAGLLILGGLAGVVVALPMSIAAAYVGFGLKQPVLAGSALTIGALVAALILMRLATVPAVLVDETRVDVPRALRASRGRHLMLAVLVIGAVVLERMIGALPGLASLPELASWSALLSPLRLAGLAWRSLLGVVSLAVMTGAIATVWRAFKQTLD